MASFRLSFTLLLTLFLLSNLVKGQDCYADWTRRTPITIDNTMNASSADGIQVRMVLNTAALVTAGQLQASGADILFVDDANCCVPLCHWVESGMNTASTVIWVKVPHVDPSSTATIVMLHGNPAATDAQDGRCTFEFFDDFSGSALDTARWLLRGTPSTSTVSGGYFTFSGNSNWEYARSKTTYAYPIGIQWKGRVTLTPSAALVMGFDATDNRYSFRINSTTLGTTYDPDVSGGNAWEDTNYPNVPGSTVSDAVFEIKSSVSGSGKIQISSFCNLSTPACTTATKTLNAFSGTSVFVGFTSYSPAYQGTWDYVFVRKRMPVDLGATTSTPSEVHVVPTVTDSAAYCSGDTVTLDGGVGFSSYAWSTGDTTQTTNVSFPGSVSWTITDLVCTFIDSTWVSELASPSLSVTPALASFCPGGSAVLSAVGGPFVSMLWSTTDTLDSILVTLPGDYILTVTDSAGCTAQDTATVLVFAAPSPSITPTPSLPVCDGTPVTLDAGAGFGSYLWSTGDSTASVLTTVADTFYVTVADSNGCFGSDTLVVEMWPLPTPSITDLGGTLDAGPGYATYQWYFTGAMLPGETSQTLVPTSSGFYTVAVTDSNGCTGVSDSIEVILTGVASVPVGMEVSISPNPFHDRFTIFASGLRDEPAHLQLVDLLGREVWSKECEVINGQLRLEVDGLQASEQILILRLRQSDRTWTGRVVRH